MSFEERGAWKLKSKITVNDECLLMKDPEGNLTTELENSHLFPMRQKRNMALFSGELPGTYQICGK